MMVMIVIRPHVCRVRDDWDPRDGSDPRDKRNDLNQRKNSVCDGNVLIHSNARDGNFLIRSRARDGNL